MRRINYLVLLIVGLGISCNTKSQDLYNESNYTLVKVNYYHDILDSRQFVYKFDTARKMQINYWDNGKILGKSFSYNGHVDGKFELYDIDGKIKMIDSFSNGKHISSKRFNAPKSPPTKIFNKGKLDTFISIDSLY